MEDYSDFIIPIYAAKNEQSFCGTGFVLNNMLITAGHVPHPGDFIFIKVGDEFILKTIYDLIRIARPGAVADDNDPDIAIYHIPGVESPLELATELPSEKDVLTNICWLRTPLGLKQITSECRFFGDSSTDLKDKIFFKFYPNKGLTHGSSGSPLLIGNKVYGMLVIGTERYNLTPEGIEALKPHFSQKEIEQYIAIMQHICTAKNAHFIQEQIKIGSNRLKF